MPCTNLEIAVLQVLEALTVAGRQRTPNLHACRMHWEQHKPPAWQPGESFGAYWKRAATATQGVVAGMFADIVVTTRQSSFTMESVPLALVQTELSALDTVISARLELTPYDDIDRVVESTVKGLCLDGLATKDEHCPSYPGAAYIRLDGCRVYVSLDEGGGACGWSVSLVTESDDCLLERLSQPSIPKHLTGAGCRVFDLNAQALPGYRLTPEGRDAIRDLPEILNPSSDWPGVAAKPATPKSSLPVWERLQVVDSNQGDDIVSLDGKDYRVQSAAAVGLLQQLQARKGETVLASTLSTLIGDRADRAYKALPRPLQKIIDKPKRGAKGYRLKS